MHAHEYRREHLLPQAQKQECRRNEIGADLVDRIETICLKFPRYGYRRVTEQLKRDRLPVNHKKVLRLMRKSDLLCRVKRWWTKTTDSKHSFPRYPNFTKGLVASHLNRVWLSDITTSASEPASPIWQPF